MKNNNTHFAFLVSVLFVVALTGCAKIEDLNPQGLTDSESVTQSVDFDSDVEATPDCNCGEVIEWRLNEDGVTIHTLAKNHCTDNVKWFSSCPDDLNPEINEVGSEFCWSGIW